MSSAEIINWAKTVRSQKNEELLRSAKGILVSACFKLDIVTKIEKYLRINSFDNAEIRLPEFKRPIIFSPVADINRVKFHVDERSFIYLCDAIIEACK